jgi:hypothetical protein
LQHKAIADRDEAQAQFMQWVSKHTNPDVAKLMNVGSDAQIQQLFFAPYCRPSDGVEILPAVREFVAENSEAFVEEGKTKAKKKRTFEVKGLGMPPISLTDSGKPFLYNNCFWLEFYIENNVFDTQANRRLMEMHCANWPATFKRNNTALRMLFSAVVMLVTRYAKFLCRFQTSFVETFDF